MPLKILPIAGARLQFIKAAMVSRAIIEHNRQGNTPTIDEEIIHPLGHLHQKQTAAIHSHARRQAGADG